METLKRSESLGRLINFSELTRHADSFIKAFNNSEPKMREIVREFQKIVGEVKKMQQETDKQRTRGAVAGGVGAGLMIFAAPFTGGLSLLAAGGLAAAGGAVVVDANVTKQREEEESARKVEELGKEFMKIVELLKNDLEGIKRTCEEMVKRSAEAQAKRSLSEMKEFQRILERVSELREKSEEVLIVVVTVLKMISDMLTLVLSFFRVTATPEEDEKLRDAIRRSADQCQKVTNAFDQMKKDLSDILD